MKTILVLLAGLAVVAAEVAIVRQCDDSISPAAACSINELRISPCPVKLNSACKLKLGADAGLSLDFTPNFAAEKLKTAVYYPAPDGEVEFSAVGLIDACPHTTCPLTAGTPNTFNYNLHIGKKLPKGFFVFRWKIWNEDNVKEMCCFETTVKLVK